MKPNSTIFGEVEENIPVHQYFLENIPNSDKLCMYNVVTRERLHFHNLAPKVFFLAKHLIKKLQLKKKDRFAVYFKQNFSLGVHVLLFLAITSCGGISTFLDSTLTKKEISFRIQRFKPKIIITHEEFIDDSLLNENTEYILTTGEKKRIFGLTVKVFPIKHFLLSFGNLDPIEQLFESNDILTIPFNGQGKAIQLSQGNLLSNIIQLLRLKEITENDIVFLHYPYHHLFTFIITFWVLIKGGKIITFPNFTLEKFLLTVSKCKVTHAFLSIEAILEIYGRFRNKSDYKDIDFSSLKAISCLGANQLSKVIQKELSEKLKIKVKQVYGYNETLILSISNFGKAIPYGSSGHLLFTTQVQVVERKTSKRLGYNQSGEILIRKAPQIMRGYVGQKEHDSFYTGDVGYFDNKEFLYILDRKQNTIEVDGKEFFQSELRDLLISHPDIMDAAILDDLGIIKGVCVKKPGSEVSTRDVIMFIFKKKLKEDENHKIINQIQFVEEIPRDSSGSVKRVALKSIKEIVNDEENINIQ